MRQLALLMLLLAAPAVAQEVPAAATPQPEPAVPAASDPAQAAPEVTPAAPAAADPVAETPAATPPAVSTEPAAPAAAVAPGTPEPGAAPAAEPLAATTTEAKPDPYPRFGMRLGVGFPEAATAAFVFRPIPLVRLSAGPAWNYYGWGLQAGVGLTPIRWYISPVFEVSYGHFFPANLTKLYTPKAGDNFSPGTLLEKVNYDYFNGQVSFEFGSPRGFTFALGVGLCYFWTNLHGTATSLPDPGSTTTVSMTNPSVRMVVPSLRLGMLYYF
jgi:hypothetical protein